MTPERIRAMLDQPQQSDNIVRLANQLNKWLKSSRSDMGMNYAHWDRNLMVYKGKMPKNADDWEARQLEEPERFIMPLSYAQVQTFVAFAFLLLSQNPDFFTLEANANQNYGMNEFVQRMLKRDLTYNAWGSKLYQILLDLARCGMAFTNTYWNTETQWVQLPVQAVDQSVGPYDLASGPTTQNVEVTRYEGNRIDNINPYRILPDTRLPLTRWRDGQFIADELEWHISQLKEFERKGMLVGTQYLSPMQRQLFDRRGPGRFWRTASSFVSTEKDPTDFMVILTQIQIKLVPKEWGLGSEDYPILHLIRLGNDNRVLSIEPSQYLHGDFTYDGAQLSPDNQSRVNESVSDVIHAIQDTVTWMLNSRISAVRKSLDSHMILDPDMFQMETVYARSPFIFAKRNMMGSQGVDKFFKQLDVRDTTQAHMQDAQTLMTMMQFVTGINENAMGQFAGGRRSATEARAVNAGAASRMKIPVIMLWQDMMNPLGRKMLINQRQGLGFDSFAKTIGDQNQYLQQMYQWYCPSNPRALIGNNDFFVFDDTLDSEKGYMAQSLQELLMAVIQSPEMSPRFDIEQMLTEIQRLRGVTNVSRFIYPAAQPNPTTGLLPGQPAQNPTAAPGQVPGQGYTLSPGGSSGSNVVAGQPGVPTLAGGSASGTLSGRIAA